MCPLSIAEKIMASLAGGGLWGSDHASVSFLAAACWCTITFSWSKCICGTFLSGLIFTCSVGIMVNVVVLAEVVREYLIVEIMSAMVVIGV